MNTSYTRIAQQDRASESPRDLEMGLIASTQPNYNSFEEQDRGSESPRDLKMTSAQPTPLPTPGTQARRIRGREPMGPIPVVAGLTATLSFSMGCWWFLYAQDKSQQNANFALALGAVFAPMAGMFVGGVVAFCRAC